MRSDDRRVCEPAGDQMSAIHPKGAAGLEKITVQLEKAEWHNYGTETMWARRLDESTFEIRNVPFYAYGISYGDVVQARRRGEQNIIENVVERSGHSTYRIFVTDREDLTKFQDFWHPLETMGCTVERATTRLFAVDVPVTASITAVYEILQAGER